MASNTAQNTPIGQLADPDLGALSDQPHPLVNFPRLYAALHDDARLYDDAHQAAQAWHNRRPWPPAVPPRDSFLDALVCSGLHRWHVRRRLARKLQVSFKEPCTLVVLPVPGIWVGHADRIVLLSADLAQDFDASAQWLAAG